MKHLALLSNLKDTITELGPINNLSPINQGIRLLGDFPQSLHADVYISAAINTNISHPFWKFCPLRDKSEMEYHNYYIRIFSENQLPKRKLGLPISALGIIVLDENLPLNETILYYIKQQSAEYAVLIILNYTDTETVAQKLKYAQNGLFVIIDMKINTIESLDALLKEHISQEQFDKLRERSFLNSLQPLLALSTETIQQEQYTSGVRKNLNTQLNSVLRKEEIDSNINDTLNSIKTQIQNWNSDMEKEIKNKYEELNKPNTGRYSQQTQKWSESLETLEHIEVAEKTERLVTEINSTFLQNFENQIKKEITSDFTNDYTYILKEADTALNKINMTLEKKINLSEDKSTLIIDYSRFPNSEKTLKSYIGFNRSYSGEVSKKGVSEYFVALREHIGTIMVVVGLLAPINMISSAAGSEAGSDPKNKESMMMHLSVIMKDVRAYIQFGTAAIIIVMIIWGYFDLRKRIPRKRKEEFERELKKAKENLLSEGKRMFNESSKDWQYNMSQWVRETYTNLQTQLDKIGKEHNTSQQQKSNEERLRIQRLNQGLDNSSKQIGNSIRTMDNLNRSHKDAIVDLEKAFR
jgi:NTP pyrophosphatase (non-canonical NTP hydrolase)